MKKNESLLSAQKQSSLQDISMEDLDLRLSKAVCPDDSLLVSPENDAFRLRANSFGTDSELSLE